MSNAEGEIQTLRATLEARERELSQLLHVIGHDMRAPLRAVVGFAELLLQSSPHELSEESRTYLDHVSEGAREMQGMLADLERYARAARRPAQPQLIDPALSLDEARRRLAPELTCAGAGLVFSTPLPRVLADAESLLEIWLQVLSNAVKFCPRPAEVRVTAEQRAREVVFSVQDDGPGIPAVDRERVFGLFVRLVPSGSHPGRGVGLALVRRCVERLGGRAWIEAGSPHGTRIVFALPTLAEDAH
ncbi:MAG: HAMP domain-containing sensor histidine kinase [Myxococcales bacterium]